MIGPSSHDPRRRIVDGLGRALVARTTYRHDDGPVFRTALKQVQQALEQVASFPFDVALATGTGMYGDELARRLGRRGIGALRVVAPPSDEDLRRLIGLVVDGEATDDLAARLDESGITTLAALAPDEPLVEPDLLPSRTASPPEPEPHPEPRPEPELPPVRPPPPRSEPASPQPSEPAPQQPSEPAPRQPSEPAPRQPSEPAPQQPSEPAPRQPSEPAPQQPSEPAPQHAPHLGPSPASDPLAEMTAYLGRSTDPWEADHLLGQWKAAVRRAAVARDGATVARLVELVRSAQPADADVQLVVASALDSAFDVETVRGLLPAVPSEPLDHTAELLAPLGPHVIPVAFTALTEEERRGRRAQLVGLLAALAGDHVERLATWLGDDRWFVVRNVLTVLRRLPSDQAVPFVVQALEHEHPRVRLEAVRALVEFGVPATADDLLRMLRDVDADVRSVALRGLAGLGDRRLVDVLVDASMPRDVRREVADVAVGLGPEAREQMRDVLGHADLPRTLKRHIQSLLGGAQDPDPESAGDRT